MRPRRWSEQEASVTRYVIVRESLESGVEAVYVGPGDGWRGWEAALALKALQQWLRESKHTETTNVVIVPASPMPDRPRGLMAKAVMEAPEFQAGVPDDDGERARLALVTSVEPAVTELWESMKDGIDPNEVWDAAKDLPEGGFSIDALREQVIKNRVRNALPGSKAQ